MNIAIIIALVQLSKLFFSFSVNLGHRLTIINIYDIILLINMESYI